MNEMLGKQCRIFVVATGAGAGIQQRLWETPGASEYLVGGAFPYSTHETDAFLGFKPARYCSRQTAIELAMTAYLRAAEDIARSGAQADPVGLAVSASVASMKEHRGSHRICAAIMTRSGVLAHDGEIWKRTGYVPRVQDGLEADAIGCDLLRMALGLKRGGGLVQTDCIEAESTLREILFAHPLFDASGVESPALLPGSFNPPHAGHMAMLKAAERASGERVAFNISVDPPHKAAPTVADILARVAKIRAATPDDAAAVPVLITRGDPLYTDKAEARPGTSFVIGADTLDRMLDPYWGPTTAEVIERLYKARAHFYLFERDGLFPGTILQRRNVPRDRLDMFSFVPGKWDISSTALRAQQQAGAVA